MAKIDIPELLEIKQILNKIILQLDQLESKSIPVWCTLSQAAELKNLSYETLKKHPEWGPDPGKAETVCGTRRWHKSVISDWLLQGDTASEASYRQLKAV